MSTELREASSATRKNIWVNIIFFAVTTVVGVVGTPLYLYQFGISSAEIWLFSLFFIATAMSITVGYHRLFGHVTFKTNKPVRFLLLFFGAAAFEQSALEWCAQHREHHRYVDTDRDPYSIKKGFFYAHIGWLTCWKHDVNYANVKDLKKDPLLINQHRYYYLWAIVAGVVTPLVLGTLTGHLLGAFVIAVCLRLTLVYHATFFINSICHLFGKSTYDIYATAKDNWLIALITFGEGYHNFHHRFPGDYRNGVRWYQWDPSKWLIALLGKLGLARDFKRVSDFQILRARLAGENRRVNDWLIRMGERRELLELSEVVRLQYQNLRRNLKNWEEAAKGHARALDRKAAHYSGELRESAQRRLVEAREHFKHSQQAWNALLRWCPHPAGPPEVVA